MGFDFSIIEPFFQLFLATFLGALVGFEREYKKKEAGLRTFALVALGTCFFTVTSIYFSSSSKLGSSIQIDPTRVIQAVAVGIGFLGSGLIIRRKAQIEGLTTAAALWAVAAIGVGIGLGLYALSIVGIALVLAILVVSKSIKRKLSGKKNRKH